MPSWILIALIAYLLFAINGVADKFLLSKVVPNPAAYAFYTGILGPLVIVFAPFGLQWLSGQLLFFALMSGLSFFGGLYYFYSAFRDISISRLLPLMGGLVPLFTLGFVYLILGETLTGNQFFAFLLLTAGAVLVSFKREHKRWHSEALLFGTIAAILFALSFTLVKHVYDSSNYVTGLFWMRFGVFAGALILLASKTARKEIFSAARQVGAKHAVVYYGARAAGGAAGLLQQYAISLGSVTIVNALQGTQFVFLLALTSLLSYRFPKIIKEEITWAIIFQKIVAIALIASGLLILAKTI